MTRYLHVRGIKQLSLVIMNMLKVALIQDHIKWEDPLHNRNVFGQRIERIGESVDLIIMPEMFTTGFSMHPEALAESIDGETVRWMTDLAHTYNVAITGSLIIVEHDKYYNRMIWATPDGELQYYDKRHLFAMAGEDDKYTRGENRVIVRYNGWRILLMVCYDLRFPVWARNNNDYDAAIYVANWPEKRSEHWRTLIRARAIENQCYVLAVNRIGEDANNFQYQGDSCIIHPSGKLLVATQSTETLILTLDKSEINAYREKLPFLNDRDSFEIKTGI